MSNIISFIKDYFLLPAQEGTGYNIYNTVVYIFLAIILIYITYLFFKYEKIKLDKKLLLKITCISILVALFRVLSDFGLVEKNIFTVTPGVPLLFYIIGLLSLKIEKIIKDDNFTFYLCAFLFVFFLIFFNIFKLNIFFILFILYILFAFILILKEKYDLLALYGQFLDAALSYINLTFLHFVEEHVVPRFLINIGGVPLFIGIKLIFACILVYLIKIEDFDPNIKKILYWSIFIIGFAPGLRNCLLAMYYY